MRKPALLMIGVLAVTSLAAAQWVPVSAKVKTVEDLFDSSGKLTHHTVTWGAYFRTSSGSTLEQWFGPDGQPQTGQLLDRGNTKKLYNLNYQSHAAIEKGDLRGHKVDGPMLPPSKAILGRDVIENIPCVILPISTSYPNGKDVVGGKAWVAADDALLILRQDDRAPLPNGTGRHFVRELYDIRLGKEPDTATMDASCSFKVLSADPNRPVCAKR